jgi:hypothetical protein
MKNREAEAVTINVNELEYKLTKVDAVPEDQRLFIERRSVYDKFLDEFVASKLKVALLELRWPDGPEFSDVEMICNGLRSRIKKRALSIRVFRRLSNVYLAQSEPEPEPESEPSDERESIDREDPRFSVEVEEPDFSVRTYNCLKNANIQTIGDLVQKSESDMLRVKYFGRKSLNEVKEILQSMDLSLGMRMS